MTGASARLPCRGGTPGESAGLILVETVGEAVAEDLLELAQGGVPLVPSQPDLEHSAGQRVLLRVHARSDLHRELCRITDQGFGELGGVGVGLPMGQRDRAPGGGGLGRQLVELGPLAPGGEPGGVDQQRFGDVGEVRVTVPEAERQGGAGCLDPALVVSGAAVELAQELSELVACGFHLEPRYQGC